MRKIVRNVGVVAVAAATLTMSLALSTGTANAATTKKTPACKAKDVSFYVSDAGSSPDVKDVGSSLFIQTKNQKPCYVRGHLTKIRLVDHSGKSYGIKTNKDTFKKPVRIQVGSGYEAEIDFRWKKPTEGEQTVEPSAVKFRLPGEKRDSQVEWRGGHVMLSSALNHSAAFPAGN